MLRPAGLAQLQQEVAAIGPQRGGDGKVAGDDRQEELESEGLGEDCSLWRRRMKQMIKKTNNSVNNTKTFLLCYTVDCQNLLW